MAGKAKRKKNSQFKEIMHRLAKNKLAMAGYCYHRNLSGYYRTPYHSVRLQCH